jgi:hypothetical protein
VQMSSAAAKPAQATTNVTLYIGDDEFAGKASGQYGHAEMDALRKFLSQYASPKEAAEALKAASKSVSCTRIPVCVSCSLVLQALGFVAHEAETEFSDEQSGGVAWNGNLKLKEFMEHLGLGGVYATALEKGKK